MFALSVYMQKTIPVLLFSGILIGIAGISDSAFSAMDPSSSTDQDHPGVTTDSLGGPGKEGAAKGSHSKRKACAEDVKKLCSDIKAGEGRITRCLKEHTQDLSKGCTDAMQRRDKRHR
jgi:hypothetical protein